MVAFSNSTFDQNPFLLSMGPQRAGSHFIYDYFKARGDVCLPTGVKEVFFFDRHFHRGPDFYAQHFLARDNHIAMSEVSSTLFDYPEAPERVFELFGSDITLICPLRHPVTRSLAVYDDYLRYGIVHGDIEAAVDQAPQILFSSRYADHLERWFDVFGRDKVKLLFYERANASLDDYYQDLCAMAGIDYCPAQPDKRLFFQKIFGSFKPHYAMSGKIVRYKKAAKPWLEKALRSEILKLEALLDERILLWTNKKS